MIGLNNLVPRVLSYWLRVGENPWNEVVDWIVVWLDWISLHKSQTACPSGPTGILDYSLRKICEIMRFALRAATWLGAIIRIGISNKDTFSSGGVWLFSGTTHYSTSIKFIVLNAQGAVPDPDLEKKVGRGGGGRVEGVSKIFFSAQRP